jgi:hypothetical protein
MKTVSKTRIFLDTNILYYANNPADAFGSQAVARINELVAECERFQKIFQLVDSFTSYYYLKNTIDSEM